MVCDIRVILISVWWQKEPGKNGMRCQNKSIYFHFITHSQENCFSETAHTPLVFYPQTLVSLERIACVNTQSNKSPRWMIMPFY